ncbi:hypothetical protein AB0P15_10350 [Streptomyces sp. NPDC087917]|uniref:hypothetical protein n=1 Tax=unclassified Streptomyces TaxID=2593676 RepID=UPI00341CF254
MNDPSTLAATQPQDRDGLPLTQDPTYGPHPTGAPDPAATSQPVGPPDPVDGAHPVMVPVVVPAAVSTVGPVTVPAAVPAAVSVSVAAPAPPAVPVAVQAVVQAPVGPTPTDQVPTHPVSTHPVSTHPVPVDPSPVVPEPPARVAPAPEPRPEAQPRPEPDSDLDPEPDLDPASAAPHAEPIRTLLETAATCRPLEEVTALVGLLKQTGQLPNLGHEALRAAAVGRPVDEVRQMVALLAESPHEEVEAAITLRAAAVGRPIEDVALLVSILGPDAAVGGTGSDAERGAARRGADGPQAGPAPTRPEPAPPTRPVRRPAPAQPPPSRGGGALRHLLRWPTAALLLLVGVLHLPGDVAVLPVAGPGALLPVAASVLCLGVGVLLALRDTAAVWRGVAVAALAVVTLHVVGGIVLFDPLDGALGGPHGWAGITAVLCAGSVAVLSGLALRYRPAEADAGERSAERSAERV